MASSLSLGDAMDSVRKLREYAVAVPEQFGTDEVKGLDCMLSKMQNMSLQSKEQATSTALWRA